MTGTPRLNGRRPFFSLDRSRTILVEASSAICGLAHVLLAAPMAAGRHVLDLGGLDWEGLPAGLHWVRVRMGAEEWRCKALYARGGGLVLSAAEVREAAPLAESAAADSLCFSKDGYRNAYQALPEASGTAPEMVMRRGAGFVPLFIGTGAIEDIATGKTVKSPMDKRIHLLLLPEGYTQADLDAGRYQRDVDFLHQAVMAIEPLGAFRQAFVVWKYPVASAAGGWEAPPPPRPRPGTWSGHSPMRPGISIRPEESPPGRRCRQEPPRAIPHPGYQNRQIGLFRGGHGLFQPVRQPPEAERMPGANPSA